MTAVAPLLLYLIARSTLIGVSPAVAIPVAALPPSNYLPVIRRVARLAAIPNFKITPAMIEMARSAAIANPLAYEPFFLASRYEEASGRRMKAVQLLEEARRRRASHLPTRMYLLVNYGQQERYAEALAELDVVLRLSGDVRTALLPELAKMLANDRARPVLARVLAREPEWREDFLRIAASSKLKPADAEDLLVRVRALKKAGDVEPERELFLRSLINAGQHGRARSVWLQSLPATSRSRHELVFDGRFEGLKAPAPFGWAIRDEDVGRAEIIKTDNRPYLDATYFGGRNMILAEQTLALSPGNYRLRLRAKSADGIRSAKISWRIYCLPGAEEIADLELSSLSSTYRGLMTNFAVPSSGCGGQKLSLIAEPGDVASVSNVQVADLEIVG